MKQTLIAKRSDRLDVYLSEELGISRSKAQKLLEKDATVNGKEVKKAGVKIKEGDEIIYEEVVEEVNNIKPSDIKYEVVYEDDDILVINKPRGLVVHPAIGHLNDTLVNALAYNYDFEELSEEDENRPGIVHRIDKDTSGLLVVAKNLESKDFLSKEIAKHNVNREYLCMVYGHPRDRFFKVDAPIARHPYKRVLMAVDVEHGKEAQTHFEVVREFKDSSLVKCTLETGRTHQIRVHLNFINHPIIGDPLYTAKKDPLFEEGQVLHAYKLELTHPRTLEKMTFYAPIDDYFKKCLITKCKL